MDEKNFRKIWEEMVSEKYLDSSRCDATFKDSHEFSLYDSFKLEDDSGEPIPIIVEEDISYVESESTYPKDTLSGITASEQQNQAVNNTLSGKTIQEEDEGTLSGQTIGKHTLSGQTLSGQTSDENAGDENLAIPSERKDYEIFCEINRGGMGTISCGRQLSLKRNIAIKQILPQNSNIPSHRQKFISEALVTAYLDHPNIVPVYQLSYDEEQNVILSMKLIDGVSWKTSLKNNTTQEERNHKLLENIKILVNVCNAVAYAHSKGIIHNDLKPDNIMVGQFGEVFVMDWGISVDISDEKAEKRTLHKSEVIKPMGTPSYIPIELAEGRGNDIGPWTDVYLLGAILYEIITGRPPHYQDTVWLSLISCREGLLPKFTDDISEELQDICYKALNKNKESRYQSIKEFQQTIEDYLQHRESIAIEEKARFVLHKSQNTVENLLKSHVKMKETQRNRLYSEFAQAVAFFEQAQMLWKGNYPAHRGELQARSLYADFALINGDIGLAEAQAELLKMSNHSQASTTLGKVQKAKKNRNKHQKRYRNLRHMLLGAILLIIVGLTLFTLSLQEEKKRTEAQTAEAARQREHAYYRRNEAINREYEAKRAQDKAEGYALALEKQKKKIVEEAQQAKETLAQIALQKANEAYEDAQWKNCGVYAGIGLELIKDFPKNVAADLQRKNRSFIRLALQKENLIWKTNPGYGNYIHKMLCIPNKETLITAAKDKDIRIWNTITGKQKFYLSGHTSEVHNILHFDSLLISASKDKTIRFWNLETRKQIQSIYCDNFLVKSMAYNGELLAVGSDGEIILFRRKNSIFHIWQRFKLSKKQPVKNLLFVNNKMLFATHNGGVLIDTIHQKVVQQFTDLTSARLTTYNPYKKILAVSDDKRIVLYKSNGSILKNIAINSPPTQMLFTSENELLSSHQNGIVTSWNLAKNTSKDMKHNTNVVAMAYDNKLGLLFASTKNQRTYVWAKNKKMSHLPIHTEAITSVAFNHSGEKVASTAKDNSIRIWNTSTGKQTRETFVHTDTITTIAFHPNKNLLASGSYDRSIKLWDLESNQNAALFGHNDDITQVIVHPSGNFFASGAKDNNVCIWEIPSGNQKKVLSNHKGAITAIAYNKSGRLLASGSEDNTICIWNQNKLLFVFDKHKATINKLLFHPQKNLLASASDDNTVCLWDIKKGRLLAKFSGHTAPVISLFFFKNKPFLFSGSKDRKIALWNLETKQLVKMYRKHRAWVTDLKGNNEFCISTSSDSNAILWNNRFVEQQRFKHSSDISAIDFHYRRSIFATSAGSNVYLWDYNGTRVFKLQGHRSWVKGISFRSGTDELASSSSDKSICIWNTNSGRKIKQLKKHNSDVNGVIYTANGNYLVSFSKNDLIIWNAHTKKVITRIIAGHTDKINDICFSPDGKKLASVSDDGLVKIWDIATKKVITQFEGHNSGIKSVDYSPKGKYLATASSDKTIRIWDVERGKANWVLFGHEDVVHEVSYNTSGNAVATASKDGTVKIWNIATGKANITLENMNNVRSLKYSKDSQMLTIAANNDIRLWDISSESMVDILTGHTSAVTDIVYSPNGKKLLSGSKDKTLRLWSIPSQPKIALRRGYNNQRINDIDYHPQGKFFATVANDYIHIWDHKSSKPINVKKFRAGKMTNIEFSNSGQEIATASQNGKITLWRSKDLSVLHSFSGHNKPITQVKYNKNASLLASCSTDASINLWSIKRQKKKITHKILASFKAHSSTVNSVAFHPNNYILASASEDKTIRIWDVENKVQLKVISRHKSAVNDVIFSPSGEFLASASDDKTIRIWHTKTWKQLYILRKHSEPIASLMFRGNSLISTSVDNTILLWDAITGKLVSRFQHSSSNITGMAYHPNGEGFISTSADATIRIWQLEKIVKRDIAMSSMPAWFKNIVAPYTQKLQPRKSMFDLRSDIPGYLLEIAIATHPRNATENLFDTKGTSTFAVINHTPITLFEIK
ncbi:protein kinase [Candidatus Uabimicrobium sp. HlEnr_7]|uniref:WD40 domain-containing protein n=1 Tax=Candidatus Uabimicrobium helgolandensis TaxID=3095367 RepID=UPI003557B22D